MKKTMERQGLLIASLCRALDDLKLEGALLPKSDLKSRLGADSTPFDEMKVILIDAAANNPCVDPSIPLKNVCCGNPAEAFLDAVTLYNKYYRGEFGLALKGLGDKLDDVVLILDKLDDRAGLEQLAREWRQEMEFSKRASEVAYVKGLERASKLELAAENLAQRVRFLNILLALC